MMGKLWPGLVVAGIVIGVIFWLRSGCNKPDVPDASQKIEAAAKAAYDSARAIDTPIIAHWKAQGDSMAKAYDTLKRKYTAASHSLQARADDLRRTIADLDAARGAHDTAGQLQRGDTLEAEVETGIPAVEGFTHLTDSMINACEAQVSIKDSIIFAQGSLAKVANSTITTQQMQYDLIHKDDVKKTNQLKFYKPVAIGGIGLLVLVLTTKLLIH